MTLMTLMNEIGEDADLLVRSDEWLEHARRSTATKMQYLAEELRAIMLAQRIKTALQQKNLVAVQQLLRDADGKIKDIAISIMNLPDALTALYANDVDTYDDLNKTAQVHGWEKDGYDVETSAQLR